MWVSNFGKGRVLPDRAILIDDAEVSLTRVAVTLTGTRCTHMHKNAVQSCTNNASRVFLEYFRCPDEFANFQLLPQVSTSKGFFRFGYGRLDRDQVSVSPSTIESDAMLSLQSVSSGEIGMRFQPDEVVENLRLERYVARGERERLLHTIYYLLRPVLPLAVRKQLQRLVFRQRLRYAFPQWPVDCFVDQIFEQLMGVKLRASGQTEIPFIWFWPDGNECALMMTHDVEQQKGADFCDFLMDLDDSYDIKAAFQLIPEGAYKDFEILASRIKNRRFELNIHDLDHDGRLYEHKELFEKRASRINEYGRRYGALGFRSGSMHRNQDWFEMLDFEYDMSVPTVSHLEPQYGGCCTVMPYFVGDVLELPLTTIQDHGLLHVLSARSIDLWKQQIATILVRHGLISFIVHPDYISEPTECELYRELLQHIQALRTTRSIWTALPGEINRWWRERSQLQLVRDGDGWQIAGEGKERARLAFASLVHGNVMYRIVDHAGGKSERTMSATVSNGSVNVQP